jgi:hypothetical protein
MMFRRGYGQRPPPQGLPGKARIQTMSDRKFDISWVDRPVSRDDPPVQGTPEVNPAPPPRGYGGEVRTLRNSEEAVDNRLLRTLAEVGLSHVVDLAADSGVEFDDALRSILRLAARRQVFIKQRDPIANDHLVAAGRPADVT